jgi:hypothetical protein
MLVRWLAHRGVELPTARRRSAKRGLVLVAPPGRLAIDMRGVSFLAGAPPFTL